jgi:hypothetical protein
LTLGSGISYNQRIRTAEFSGREALWAVPSHAPLPGRPEKREAKNRRHRWNT